jgi:hypothetical protein
MMLRRLLMLLLLALPFSLWAQTVLQAELQILKTCLWPVLLSIQLKNVNTNRCKRQLHYHGSQQQFGDFLGRFCIQNR